MTSSGLDDPRVNRQNSAGSAPLGAARKAGKPPPSLKLLLVAVVVGALLTALAVSLLRDSGRDRVLVTPLGGDVCRFLSAEELARFVAVPPGTLPGVSATRPTANDPDHERCFYALSRLSEPMRHVKVSYEGPELFAFNSAREGATAVTGLGDRAVWIDADLEGVSAPALAILVGERTVLISSYNFDNGYEVATRAAQIILPRISARGAGQ
jgi:hypothetical protein